jgi:hypothetical protein
MGRGNIFNNPISSCPRGQGGRTFSRLKPKGKKHAPPGCPPNEAHSRHLRQKVQPIPRGRARFPYGKYYDWQADPEGNNAVESRRSRR